LRSVQNTTYNLGEIALKVGRRVGVDRVLNRSNILLQKLGKTGVIIEKQKFAQKLNSN